MLCCMLVTKTVHNMCTIGLASKDYVARKEQRASKILLSSVSKIQSVVIGDWDRIFIVFEPPLLISTLNVALVLAFVISRSLLYVKVTRL